MFIWYWPINGYVKGKKEVLFMPKANMKRKTEEDCPSDCCLMIPPVGWDCE